MRFRGGLFRAIPLVLLLTASAFAQEVTRGAQVINSTHVSISPPLREMRAVPAAHRNYNFPIQIMPHYGSSNVPAKGPSFFNDSATQMTTGPLITINSGGISRDGVGEGFVGGAYPNGYTVPGSPSDANGAVGDTQFVEWVNTAFAVFDKSTGNLLYGPVDGNTLYAGTPNCANTNDGDIIVLWDKFAHRWLMSQLSVSGGNGYFQCVALSQTADATGSWVRYEFPMPNFNDYPKLSIWPDPSNNYYLFSFNQFQDFLGLTYIYQGPEACAFQRSAMLNAQPASLQCMFINNTNYSSLVPADVDGSTLPPSGSPGLFIALGAVDGSGNGSSLLRWTLSVNWSNGSNTHLTGPTAISVNSFAEACGGGTCVPQPNTSQQLDTIGDRLMYRLAYRNFGTYESVVAAHSVNSPYGTTGIRWYEIRTPFGTPTVYQQGTYAPNDGGYRWMPSMAMDKAGDIAVVYSESNGTNLYPSIAYTGRLATDPANVLQTENLAWQGTGSQLNDPIFGAGNRWGDYWSLSVDPSDDCTFWYTAEYLKTSGSFNWNTRIGSFSFPNCTGTTTPNFSVSATPSSAGTNVVFPGGTASYTVTVSSQNNFSGSVSLSAIAGLPAGATAMFVPSSVNVPAGGSATSTMTIATTSGTTPAANSTITIQGSATINSSVVNNTTTAGRDLC